MNSIILASTYYSLINQGKDRYNQRVHAIARLMSEILLELQVQTNLQLCILNSVTAIPQSGSGVVCIPYLFLIQKEDFPQYFKTKIMSTQPFNDQFLLDFANWTLLFMGIPRIKTRLSFQEKEILRLFFHIIKKTDSTEKILKFILTHEIIHILEKDRHGSNDPFYLCYSAFYSPLPSVIGTIGLLFLIMWHLDLFHSELMWPYSIALYLISVIAVLIKRSRHSKTCEKRADIKAAQKVRGAKEGGIDLFTQMIDYQKKSKSWLYSKQGNSLIFSFTHPLEKERLHYLQKISVTN